MMNSVNNNVNFAGIPIAKANGFIKETGKPVKFDVYKLAERDIPFLEKLEDRLHIQAIKEMGNMTYESKNKSFALVVLGVIKDTLGCKESTNYLIAADGIPCGLLKHTNELTHDMLDFIATWNNKPNKTIKQAGQTLMNTLFSKDEKVVNSIELKDTTCVKGKKNFYTQLQFKNGAEFSSDFYKPRSKPLAGKPMTKPSVNRRNISTYKSILAGQIKRTREQLTEKLGFKKIDNTPEVNLEEVLNYRDA